MDAFLISTGIVALAEIGDKTQLLAFILAAKFRRPVPIILGILVATLLNHGFAGAIGAWLTALIAPDTMRWILGLSFLAMAGWTLIPDKFDEDDAKLARMGELQTTHSQYAVTLSQEREREGRHYRGQRAQRGSHRADICRPGRLRLYSSRLPHECFYPLPRCSGYSCSACCGLRSLRQVRHPQSLDGYCIACS